MELASCTTAVCLQLALGFTMQVAPKTEPTITVAVYQARGCSDFDNIELASGCLRVPKARDKFYVPCGAYDCPIAYRAKYTNWGPNPVQKLPPVTVEAPRVRKVRHYRSSKGKGTSGRTTQGQSIGEQIATQLARQGTVMGAQMGGALAGTAVGGPIGALVGGWLGCTGAVYGFVQNDFAKKERWDLHPELAQANFTHSLVSCSLIGFLQRAKEAPTDRDRAVALVSGLALAPVPTLSVIGQIAPAADAAVSNLQLLTKVKKKKK